MEFFFGFSRPTWKSSPQHGFVSQCWAGPRELVWWLWKLVSVMATIQLMENKRFIQYIAQCDSWSTCGSKPISMLFLTESDYTPRTRRIPPPKSKMKVLMMWHLEMRICAVMELSDIGPQELLVGVFFCFLLSFRIKKKLPNKDLPFGERTLIFLNLSTWNQHSNEL